MFITSLVMSVVHGAIFWNVRGTVPGFQAEQEDINDRLALHYVFATVAIWPTLMLMITDVWRERESVARDVRDRLYGRFVFFLSKVSISEYFMKWCTSRIPAYSSKSDGWLIIQVRVEVSLTLSCNFKP